MKSVFSKLRAAVLLSLIPGFLGLLLIFWPATAFLENTGLDILFLKRGQRPVPSQICVVAIDEDSYWLQNLDPGLPWPRGLHGDLVRVLAREGALAIAFDVLFEGPGDPEQDAAFEAGLREAGNVVLGVTEEQTEDPRFRQVRLIEPHDPFKEAAAAIGDVRMREDRDGVIRHAWLLHGDRPSLALAAYEIATGDTSKREHGLRMLNFYGASRTIPTVSLYQALDPGEYLPPGFFKDKIVFVGASQVAASGPAEAKDSFGTPYRGDRGNTFGVEIHATLAANLLEGRSLDVASPAVLVISLLLLSFLATLTFVLLRPVLGLLALAGFTLVPTTASYLAFSRGDLWLPLIIPTVIQLPIAYVVSLAWYYFTTVRERERIRRAFTFYLSPNMIKRITESPGELNLGGEEIVGTAMFTDIRGFTSIAEGMTAPETASLLNDYFSEATRHVFETQGTLIKYIGDAIFAIWGAPLKMADHATPACRAAVGMTRLSEALGDRPAGKLGTRIGVHTGTMLVGNLGSSQRFDYTAIGDTINLAARLEGINKYFGTQALISDETLSAANGNLVTRRVGRVQVVGRAKPVTVHELLGMAGELTRPDGPTIRLFDGALEAYYARDFETARQGFEEVCRVRGGKDAPSELYLRFLSELKTSPPGDDWDGVIRLTSK